MMTGITLLLPYTTAGIAANVIIAKLMSFCAHSLMNKYIIGPMLIKYTKIQLPYRRGQVL